MDPDSASFADPLDDLRDARERLAAEDRSGWSGAALGDRIMSVARERERLDAELTRLVAQWDGAGAWAEDGYASPSAWLCANAPVAKPAAGRLLRSARHVRRFAATGAALAAGVVTTEKVEVLAEAARHREKLYARDEQVLLDAASRLEVRDLTTAVRTWRMLADDETATNEPNDAFARVHLHVSPTLLGGVLSGFLDPEATTLLTNALDHLEPPDPVIGPDAPRSLSQRRGEGLVKLARFYLDARAAGRESQGDAPAARRAVPSVELVFTVDSLRGIGALALDDHRCDLAGFGSVPLDTIHRLACEAQVGWITLNGDRVPFDMGRWRRTPTMMQRRAVIVRDRHCQYPGCRAPARWCDVHHLLPWDAGGTTDLTNLVLLCRRHHVKVHEGRRQLVRNPDGTYRIERRPRTSEHREHSQRAERSAAPTRGDPTARDG